MRDECVIPPPACVNYTWSSRCRCFIIGPGLTPPALQLVRLWAGARNWFRAGHVHKTVTRRTAATVTLIAAVCTFSECGDQTARPELAKPAASATTATNRGVSTSLPQSYAFTLTSSCGERGLLGDYRVTVRDEQVSAVENLNKDYPYEPTFDEIPTLQDIVALAESARPDAIVEYVVDDAGVPRSLSLDPVPNGIDDESCYEVTDLLTGA